MRVLQEVRLADLLYGHEGRYIQQLKKPYDSCRAAMAPISLGQLDCGCWMVLDGNGRTGLLLSTNPDATVADYPPDAVIALSKGEWDVETVDWFNPAPRTFAEVMSSAKKKLCVRGKRKDRRTFYGFIERTSDDHYCGVITSTLAQGGTVTARGRTSTQVEARLRAALTRRFGFGQQSVVGDFDIELLGLAEATYVHVCGRASAEP